MAVCGCKERGCSCPVFPSHPSLPTNRLVTLPTWLPKDAWGMFLQGGDKRLRYKWKKKSKQSAGLLSAVSFPLLLDTQTWKVLLKCLRSRVFPKTRTWNRWLRMHGENEIGLVTHASCLSSIQQGPKSRLLGTSTIGLVGYPFRSTSCLPFGVAKWWLEVFPISILDSQGSGCWRSKCVTSHCCSYWAPWHLSLCAFNGSWFDFLSNSGWLQEAGSTLCEPMEAWPSFLPKALDDSLQALKGSVRQFSGWRLLPPSPRS